MNNTIKVLIALTIFATTIFSEGIFKIMEGGSGYISPIQTNVQVVINNQVATTTARQTFVNTGGQNLKVKYCFPLPLQASVTGIAWEMDSMRTIGTIQAGPQDSSTAGSGGTPDYALQSYLGGSPFYFQIPDSIAPGAEITFEITYIELLGYRGGLVTYQYPYETPAQFTSGTMELFQATMTLNSQKKITSITSNIWPGEQMTRNDYTAQYSLILPNPGTARNFELSYQLDNTDLGLFMISHMPDSGQGYFLMLAEPDPKTSQAGVIDKIFTYVIDVSGSMGGTKIQQAKDAAKYCIQNLNFEDRFNIIKFSDMGSLYQNAPIQATNTNITAALAYIDGIAAGGGTNIDAALSTALGGYTTTTTSNIIIFLTDGVSTSGVTAASSILADVKAANMQNVRIFPFGIGTDVNKALLTKMALDNNGSADFVDNSEVTAKISEFYAKIKDPVIKDISLSFSAGGVDQADLLPINIPDIYVGQQLVVAGRYTVAGPTTVTMNGANTAGLVSYAYDALFSGAGDNPFVAKVWAKMRIDALISLIYTVGETSTLGQEYKAEVIRLSLEYGIQTKYTSYVAGESGPITETEDVSGSELGNALVLTNYPNPFNPTTTLSFTLPPDIDGAFVMLKIYDLRGKLIAVLEARKLRAGTYEFTWNSRNIQGKIMPSGMYIAVLKTGNIEVRRVITLCK